MNPEDAVELGREALRACMMVGGPIIIVGLIVGLVIGILQAMTQIQDQTVSFVPKILVMIVGIGVALPWLSEKMVDYTKEALESPAIHMAGPSVSWESQNDPPIPANPFENEAADEQTRDDRLAGDRFSDHMPKLRQKYSMPTMKSARPNSMPRMKPSIQPPRVAEIQEFDF